MLWSGRKNIASISSKQIGGKSYVERETRENLIFMPNLEGLGLNGFPIPELCSPVLTSCSFSQCSRYLSSLSAVNLIELSFSACLLSDLTPSSLHRSPHLTKLAFDKMIPVTFDTYDVQSIQKILVYHFLTETTSYTLICFLEFDRSGFVVLFVDHKNRRLASCCQLADLKHAIVHELNWYWTNWKICLVCKS